MLFMKLSLPWTKEEDVAVPRRSLYACACTYAVTKERTLQANRICNMPHMKYHMIKLQRRMDNHDERPYVEAVQIPESRYPLSP